jgi:hypothetical protein
VRVYQFRHIRAVGSEDIAPAPAGGEPEVVLRDSAMLPGFASLRSVGLRAAIVQGTRTPPSHGGNPGSNPGSGIENPPRNRGFFSF